MTNRILLVLVVVLTLIVFVMAWVLFVTPVEAPVVSDSTTEEPTPAPEDQQGPAPLHERVVITSPKPNAVVGDEFIVRGEAPGPWYFEASFPIQVRDADGNVLARTHANALGEWMTEGQVLFESTIYIDSYKGSATLILMKDNPSGLPEHDDALEVPIVIQ